MASSAPKALRCAIYCRKSSEEGLDQAYNSLDAQRDACAAYIRSQVSEGWVLTPEVYDDGGFSGGNLERPGFKRLMDKIEAGKIDVVVVYKVDRLTRSLTDFAKIVEVLDRKGASFVSVTQAFNTTTSMGRLTLNVLLSFAQFEREVTGERIRDKIAASKTLGMWMGGNVPFGYSPKGRTLEIVPDEAGTVRMIFERYLALGSVHQLAKDLATDKIVSKAWVTKAGKARGGLALNRGALFYLLRNRLYIGQIPHKDKVYPGQHRAIIDPDLFAAVQAKLDEAATILKREAKDKNAVLPHKGAPLTGLIFDTAANLMSPVSARRKGGATYRYYVSRVLQSGQPDRAGALARVPASLIEDLIVQRFKALSLINGAVQDPDWAEIRRHLDRIEVWPNGLRLGLAAATVERLGGAAVFATQIGQDDRLVQDGELTCLIIALAFQKRGGVTQATSPNGDHAVLQPRSDAALSSALVRAEAWKRALLSGQAKTLNDIARQEGVTANYVSRILRTAFLAPDLKSAILDGTQPVHLSLQAIMTADVPLDWNTQRQLYRG